MEHTEKYIIELVEYIEELEKDFIKVMQERDEAEEALGEVFEAVTGSRPVWSNMFSYPDVVDSVWSKHITKYEAAALMHIYKYYVEQGEPNLEGLDSAWVTLRNILEA